MDGRVGFPLDRGTLRWLASLALATGILVTGGTGRTRLAAAFHVSLFAWGCPGGRVESFDATCQGSYKA